MFVKVEEHILLAKLRAILRKEEEKPEEERDQEFIALAYENHWRVTEEPVEILYTEYSMSKGQPLLNGVNIIFDGWLRGRMSR